MKKSLILAAAVAVILSSTAGAALADTGYGGGGGSGIVLGLYGGGGGTPAAPSTGGNGGGTGSGSGNGQVLGAATSTPTQPNVCPTGVYLNLPPWLSIGRKATNNAHEVALLQAFLNSNMGTNLTSGVFDQATFAAVQAFQVKYYDEILKPYDPTGAEGAFAPTGYVGPYTTAEINRLACNG
jgi:hypothetical protein